MAITLTSTTESTESLQHGVSDEWRTPPPAKPEESPAATNGEIPIDTLPPKKFSEVREQQIAAKKEATAEFLEGEDRDRPRGGGAQKRIDKAVKNWRMEESRRIAVEKELGELKARLSTAPTPTQTPASSDAKQAEPQAAPQPQAQPQRTEPPTPHQQRMNQGRGKYADFDAVLAEADRSGFRLPAESMQLLKNLPNSSDVMYLIAKNPQFRQQISANPQQATETIRRVGGVLELEGLTNPASWQSFNARVAELQNNKDFNPRLLLDLPEFLRPAITDEGGAGADILLHLGRNPDIAKEIAQMRPDAALKRLGQISGQLTKPKPKVEPPAPISPVGASSTPTGTIPLDELPPREYNRVRDAQERARKRGR